MTSQGATMDNKLTTLVDAVSDFVRPGMSVYLGNFGAQLFCVGHELIRQDLSEIDAVIASGGLLMDQLLGARVLRSATYGHCWSPVGPSPAWNFRRAAESGDSTVTLYEMSLGLIAAALTAGAWGVPFMPVPGLPGTGYADENWPNGRLSTVSSEFGNTAIVRAITPDVAFVHVDKADVQGNGVINGPLGEVVLAAQASTTVVVVAEEIVTTEEAISEGISIPGLLTTAVIHHAGAVAPDGVIGRYDRDVAAYEDYVSRAATQEGFAVWMSDLLSSASSVTHNGGRDRHA